MKLYKNIACVMLLISIAFTGCTKFGVAESEISSFEVQNDRQLSISAIIKDAGGCDYFIEQGFCYSLFKEPALTDVYSTVVTVAENSDSLSFSADITLPLVDTAYYVRAYVKNSAGLSYSNQVKVSTKPQNNNE